MTDIALDEIRRRVRNIWGAISSNQVIDKDVEGQAKQLLDYLDDLRRASPSQVAPQPQAGEPVAWLGRDSQNDRWNFLRKPPGVGAWAETMPLYAYPQPANTAQVTDAQIEHMVQQFLRWKLPEDFNPDGGISFDPIMNLGTEHQSRREPIGTNLFDYRQAKAMVQHMLDGLAAIGAGGQAVADDATISEMVRAYNRTTDYIFPQATDKEQREAMRAVYATLFQRTCTCHPDDSPPSPCAEKYALSECRNSADERVVEALPQAMREQGIRWAVGRWRAEVENRPLVNIHRRSLDDSWRQVIRHFGGDPEALCGRAHDELLTLAKEGR